MDMNRPAAGTDRYLCPLIGCDWHYDSPPFDVRVSLHRALGPVIDNIVLRASMERHAEIDRTVARHLTEHSVVDFVRTIAVLQSQLTACRSAWERGGGDMPAG